MRAGRTRSAAGWRQLYLPVRNGWGSWRGGRPFEIFQTTSSLVDIDDEIEDLIANSQTPDLLFPSQILNPTTFVGFFRNLAR